MAVVLVPILLVVLLVAYAFHARRVGFWQARGVAAPGSFMRKLQVALAVVAAIGLVALALS